MRTYTTKHLPRSTVSCCRGRAGVGGTSLRAIIFKLLLFKIFSWIYKGSHLSWWAVKFCSRILSAGNVRLASSPRGTHHVRKSRCLCSMAAAATPVTTNLYRRDDQLKRGLFCSGLSAFGPPFFLACCQVCCIPAQQRIMQQNQQGRGERPYRSHLRPACLACRRRKSRCHTEPGADRCLMCRAHGTDCLFPGGSPGPTSKDSPDQVARRRGRGKSSATPRITTPPFHTVSSPRAHPTVASTSIPGSQNGDMVAGSASSSSAYNPSLNPPPNRSHHQQEMHGGDSPSIEFGSADDHASNLHIVGPATTKDNQVLSDYLSAIPGATRGTRMVVPVPASRSRPVLFTRVQKRPFGVPVNRSPSAEKLEMIEKLLEPYAGDVIDL